MSTITTTPPKLSLLSAIFININIMLGTGIFINTVGLASETGALCTVVYGMVGILILPLILAFSELMSYYPTGGTFYDFGSYIHPLVGFINTWAYFIGKLATPAIGIHVFVTLMQQINPLLAHYNTLMIDTGFVLFFVLLNTFNLKTGRNINYFFIILKLIPILFVIFSAFFLFNPINFNVPFLPWENIPATVPIIIFALTGFEASCSLSRQIENPEKNGPRAILISYIITLSILMLYQFSFFGILGSCLSMLDGYQEVFPFLIKKCIPNSQQWQYFFKAITLSGIATSALGSSYGVIYSNIWNLHLLAEKNLLFKAHFFMRKNKYGTPFICVVTAGCIILLYQWFSHGNLIPLQLISSTGNLSVYTISIASFTIMCFRNGRKQWLALLSLASCLLLCSTVVMNAYAYGALPLGIFLSIIVAGIGMFFATQKHSFLAKK